MQGVSGEGAGTEQCPEPQSGAALALTLTGSTSLDAPPIGLPYTVTHAVTHTGLLEQVGMETSRC